MILLGRLALFGPRAGRLHDQLIAVAARWRPAAARTGPLEPYKEKGGAEERTMELLDAALPEGDRHPVPVEVQQRLTQTLTQDVNDLRPHLENRAEEAREEAGRLLAIRATREAGDLERLIRERRKRILDAQKSAHQLELDFAGDDLKQLRAEQRHWERRLADLERELREEPQRLVDSYQVRTARVEPVGIVYLWPLSG